MEQGLTIPRKSDEWRSTEFDSDSDSDESSFFDEDDEEYNKYFPPEEPETEEAQNERNIATARKLGLDPDADVNDNLDAILGRIGVDCSKLPTLEDTHFFYPEKIVCAWDSEEEEASGKPEKEIRRLKKLKMKKFFKKRVTLGKFPYTPNEFLDTKFDPFKLDGVDEEVKKKKVKKNKVKKNPVPRSTPPAPSGPPPAKRPRVDSFDVDNVSPMPSMPGTPSRSPTPGTPSSSSSTLRRRSQSLSVKFNIPEISRIMARKVPVGVELDTKSLGTRLAKELKDAGISQAIFSESILRRSQGTLSDLLRNPKPWNMLKQGCETFERMKNWLELDKEVRESLCELSGEDAAMVMGFDCSPAPQKHGPKKHRLKFTEHQRTALQAAFHDKPDPSMSQMNELAKSLDLDLSTIRNFFGNYKRRAKLWGAEPPREDQQKVAEEEEDPTAR